jgi:putative hydrolase of the HAD superfamily
VARDIGGRVGVTVAAVVFDWGGTITPFHDADLRDLWSLVARQAAPSQARELADALERAENAWWDEAIRTGRAGTATEVLAAVSAAVRLDVSPAVRDITMRRHLEVWTPHTVADPEALLVLHLLRAKGVRIGMLTNTHWPRSWHERWLARDGLLDLFDARIYTNDLPFIKPHPGAFGAVLSALRIDDPSTAVFVGDRPINDIWGAQQIGMRTILLQSDEVPGYDVRPDASVSRLGQVLDWVDAWSAPPLPHLPALTAGPSAPLVPGAFGP